MLCLRLAMTKLFLARNDEIYCHCAGLQSKAGKLCDRSAATKQSTLSIENSFNILDNINGESLSFMKNKKVDFFTTLFHLGPRTVTAIIIAILIAAMTLSAASQAFYKIVKDSISRQGELNAKRTSEEFKNHLISSKNSILLTAYTLNEMLDNNTPTEEMLRFMISETNNIQNSVNQEFTGLYAWINGQFLDGSGWVPDEDYIPTERPWYKITMKQKTPLVYIKPYLDMQTKTMMMTISKILNDNESVAALDISLNQLQKVMESLSQDSNEDYLMILDFNGDVVVHSDKNSFEKDTFNGPNSLNALIHQTMLKEHSHNFSVNYNGKKFIIYAEELEGGWHSISAINANEFYKPLHHILGSALIAIIMASILILYVFVNMARKSFIEKNLNLRIQTIADIYESMFDLDIKHNTFTSITSTPLIDNAINNAQGDAHNAQEILNSVMDQLTDEVSKPIINQFIDFSTMDKRMNGTTSITEEFLAKNGIWCRGRFIVAARDEDGSIYRLLWVVESIDKEKRHRDELKHLSETDRLTNIENRGSGEYKISELISKNESGMFILLDVDNFKSINDYYGHNAGDKVLVSIAQALKNAFRSGDVVMRLGGDEFVAYAVGVHNKDEGTHVINRLFKNIEKIQLEELGYRRVCVSIGAYCYDGKDAMTFKDLYNIADKGTYQSKKAEGNAITFCKK